MPSWLVEHRATGALLKMWKRLRDWGPQSIAFSWVISGWIPWFMADITNKLLDQKPPWPSPLEEASSQLCALQRYWEIDADNKSTSSTRTCWCWFHVRLWRAVSQNIQRFLFRFTVTSRRCGGGWSWGRSFPACNCIATLGLLATFWGFAAAKDHVTIQNGHSATTAAHFLHKIRTTPQRETTLRSKMATAPQFVHKIHTAPQRETTLRR